MLNIFEILLQLDRPDPFSILKLTSCALTTIVLFPKVEATIAVDQ